MPIPRTAIIPLGGEAVRLRPLTLVTSKAMIRILNKPLLEFAIVELAVNGVDTIYLGVRGYHNYVTTYDYFREGYWIRVRYPFISHDVRIRYMPRYETWGNADAVRILLEYYDLREPFIVVQGDTLFHTDLRRVYEFHEEKGADMTVVLMEVDDVREFGVAELMADSRIRRFVEKPPPEEAPSRLANTGIYVFSSDIRNFFESAEGRRLLEERRMDFGRDVIPELIRLGYRVYGYVMHGGYWFDVGTPERYLHAVQYLLRELDAERLEASEFIPGVFMQGKSETSRALHMQLVKAFREGRLKFEGRNLLGRHIRIGNGTTVKNSSIDNYVSIGSDCVIEDSAMMDRIFVGNGVRVINSIVGRHSYIEDYAMVVNSVLGDDSYVGRGTRLVNVKVWPHMRVPPGTHLENYVVGV